MNGLADVEFLAKLRMQELQREAERYRVALHRPSLFALWMRRRHH